jgi:hypothetical protein
MPLFAQVSQFFPLVLAPATIRLARQQKRLAGLDGILLVWATVVGAAVLWTVFLAVVFDEPVGRDVVRRGLVLGVVAAFGHTLATGKGKGLLPAQPSAAPPGTVSLPMPPAPPTEIAPVDVTPANTGAQREMDLDWGSPKDGGEGAGEVREG